MPVKNELSVSMKKKYCNRDVSSVHVSCYQHVDLELIIIEYLVYSRHTSYISGREKEMVPRGNKMVPRGNKMVPRGNKMVPRGNKMVSMPTSTIHHR